MSWGNIFLTIVIIYILYIIYKQWFTMVSARSTIYRFYRPGCKYCVESQPEWDRFRQIVRNDFNLYMRVGIVEINLDDAKNDQGIISSFNIPGVPYVVKVTESGKRVNYDGERTAEGYVRFVKYG